MPPSPMRLRLAGELPPAPAKTGPAIGAKGFRPFFLLAGVFAAALVPIWLLALLGRFDPGAYLGAMNWHAHEMVFGFATAVLAGFLLTAVGNWTQRETVVGGWLLALAGLWLAGRFALLGARFLPRGIPALVDIAFLPLLGVALARPLVAAKNRRNFVMLAVLAALAAANVAVHLDALGIAMPGWRRRGSLAGVDVVVFVMVVMAGRIVPMFTRNATGVETIRNSPTLDTASVACAAIMTGVDVALPESRIGAIVACATAIILTARTWNWGAVHAVRVPLLWILHIGYAWIPIGLMLRAVSAFTPRAPAPIATHALTVGAIGALTLGMMSRVSLGHTGRALVTSRAVVASFVLVTLAALLRVCVPLIDIAWSRAGALSAGACWTAAFGIFVVAYAPVLLAPRVDGKAG